MQRTRCLHRASTVYTPGAAHRAPFTINSDDKDRTVLAPEVEGRDSVAAGTVRDALLTRTAERVTTAAAVEKVQADMALSVV